MRVPGRGCWKSDPALMHDANQSAVELHLPADLFVVLHKPGQSLDTPSQEGTRKNVTSKMHNLILWLLCACCSVCLGSSFFVLEAAT